MRARPEPTQMEHLSDVSFLGKLLVLPANVRLDWKVIARNKHSSLFGHIISNKGKKFNNIDTWSCSQVFKILFNLVKTFRFLQWTKGHSSALYNRIMLTKCLSNKFFLTERLGTKRSALRCFQGTLTEG